MDQSPDRAMRALPHARGAYALFMTVLAPVRLTIGALGAADFPAGANFSQVHIPVPGFGASDCPSTCLAHLVAFPLEVDPKRLCRLLDASLLCYHNLG